MSNEHKEMSEQEWQDSVKSYNEAQAKIATLKTGQQQQQVRSMHEQPQSTAAVWDAATEARWNGWLDARCKNLIVTEWNEWGNKIVLDIMEDMCGAIGEEAGKAECELRDQLRKEFAAEITKVEKKFAAKILKMQKETVTRGANIVTLPNPLVIRKQ
jgi:hypothetical protein